MFSDAIIKPEKVVKILTDKYKIAPPVLFKWRDRFMNSFAEDITEYYKYQGFELGKAEGKAESDERFAKILSAYILSQRPATMAEAIAVLDGYNLPKDLYDLTIGEIRKGSDFQ